MNKVSSFALCEYGRYFAIYKDTEIGGRAVIKDPVIGWAAIEDREPTGDTNVFALVHDDPTTGELAVAADNPNFLGVVHADLIIKTDEKTLLAVLYVEDSETW